MGAVGNQQGSGAVGVESAPRGLARLVSPVVAVMEGMPLGRRMTLLGSIGLVAMLVTLAFFIPMLGRDVDFVRKERGAAQAIGPIIDLVVQAQRHRGNMSRLLKGDGSARAAVDAAVKQAEASISETDAYFAGTGAKLGLGDRWAKLRDDWRKLVATGQTLAPQDNFNRHTEMI